jgi:COMPASS component SWD2
MQFNKSGKQILFCSKGGVVTVDGYEGTVLHSFLAESEDNGSSSLPTAGCFTPDDKTVLCGNENGTISCYDVNTGLLVRKLRGHVDRVGCVAVNPRYMQFASACTNTALWIW